MRFSLCYWLRSRESSHPTTPRPCLCLRVITECHPAGLTLHKAVNVLTVTAIFCVVSYNVQCNAAAPWEAHGGPWNGSCLQSPSFSFLWVGIEELHFNFVSLQLLPKFSWAGKDTGNVAVCITSWESTGVEGTWEGCNSCWKLFAVWFLGDSMTHCIFPCSLHLSTIYQLTHLIKTDKKSFRKIIESFSIEWGH